MDGTFVFSFLFGKKFICVIFWKEERKVRTFKKDPHIFSQLFKIAKVSRSGKLKLGGMFARHFVIKIAFPQLPKMIRPPIEQQNEFCAHLMHKTQQIHSKIELNTMQNTDLPKKLKSYVVEAFKLYKGMNPPPPLKRVGMSSPQPNGLDWIDGVPLP